MTNGKQSKFLVRHVGNMGDIVFLVPPVLAALKKEHPGCHITLVTSWGYKDGRGRWGKRNQSGQSLHLMMTNPNVDELVHWHDNKLSLDKKICCEDGRCFATWSRDHYEQKKNSGDYDKVIELDFGIKINENPLENAFTVAGVSKQNRSDYQIYLTEKDKEVARHVAQDWPKPRIVLTDSLKGTTTRNWDPRKVEELTEKIKQEYGVEPIWFGANAPYYFGRRLSLRENIATLLYCDVCIGVLSGPLHFAAAVGLPTLILYCDYPLRRAAPGYFFNKYIEEDKKKHRTLLGPADGSEQQLKPEEPYSCMTKRQVEKQGFKDWSHPGRQATKSCLSVITVDEVMTVLSGMV